MHNKLFFLVLIVLMTTGMSPVMAARYTILYMNTKTVAIGNKQLKVGDTFDEKDINAIKWASSTQCIKVRNEATKRTRVLTRRNVETAEQPSLKEYLVKKRGLYTRDYTPLKTVQLLDTVTFDLTGMSTGRIKYRAVWKERKVWTSLPLSSEGDKLYLTRSIFGHHNSQPANITVLEYDLDTNSEPTRLGELFVEPLPFVIP